MKDFIFFSTSVVNTADEEICPGSDWPSYGMVDYSEPGIKRPAIFSIIFFLKSCGPNFFFDKYHVCFTAFAVFARGYKGMGYGVILARAMPGSIAASPDVLLVPLTDIRKVRRMLQS